MTTNKRIIACLPALALLLLLGGSAAAVDLRYQWKKATLYRFHTASDQTVSMSAGGMGGFHAKFKVDSTWALYVESVDPAGVASAVLVIESFTVTDGAGRTLATVDSLPKRALEVPLEIDAKGRFKLPAKLREQLETAFGREVYVCSFFPHELRVYPLAMWQGVEERLLSKPAMKPAILKLVERVNYGQLLEVDEQGRILVPVLLREMVDVEGEVVVSGRINHLAVTNRSRAASFLKEASLSNEELEELAQLEL